MSILNLIRKQLDKSLTSEEIQKFVLKKYTKICCDQKQPKETIKVLSEIQDNLNFLKWTEVCEKFQVLNPDQKMESMKEALNWVNELVNGRVINRGIVAKGSGYYLDYLDVNVPQKNKFVIDSMEILLKHVEVKRKKTLNSLPSETPYSQTLIEVAALSLLFSRFAKRHTDLRFLNASFKINDWCFSKFQKLECGKPIIYYLYALTEQERCAVEMLR